MERKEIGGMPDMVTRFEPLGLFTLLLREVWGLPQGKPETRQQMVE
jgi:hypothetical protein